MIEVIHQPAHHYFAIKLDGEPIGRLDYEPKGADAYVTHVEMDAPHQGHEYASTLTRQALAELSCDYKIIPRCPYVIAYLIRHPKER